MGNYRRKCEEVVEAGYAGFVFSPRIDVATEAV
jgi:hypothetical protein